MVRREHTWQDGGYSMDSMRVLWNRIVWLAVR
jgi:hypothetical protein